jgi:hypothetical protein
VFSIVYLFVLFSAVLVDHTGSQFSFEPSSRSHRSVETANAGRVSQAIRCACGFVELRAREV